MNPRGDTLRIAFLGQPSRAVKTSFEQLSRRSPYELILIAPLASLAALARSLRSPNGVSKMSRLWASWKHLRNILEPSWAFHGIESLQKHLQEDQKSLHTSKTRLQDASKTVLEPSWPIWGASWRLLGPFWRYLGAILTSIKPSRPFKKP